MLSTAQDVAPGRFTVDEASHTIRFMRELAAEPNAVFAAWTQPEQISRWWDPNGKTLATCEIDLRVGGGFKFVQSEHPEMPFAGTYRVIDPPARLEFDALGALGKVSLEPREAGTQMTVEIVCQSAEHLAQFIQHGVAEGTAKTLDNLVAFVS